ncbi:MAG TPA: ParM/StbA family protein [Aggregatilineales bacterium]|nr:ParM/StbA family protein [Anaerolineales bacterium]HRE48801.1 ParM/StbA family protein [Aggregatilineales bacterium]
MTGVIEMGKKQTAARTLPHPTEIQAISLDLGNGYCNLMADGGISADWRSVQGRLSDATRFNDLPFDDVINISGVWWAFGAGAYTYAARSLEDFPATNRYFSEWYKRLFTYALHRAYGVRLGEGIFYPRVVLSIPAGIFANEDVVQRVKESLAGDYQIGTTRGSELRVKIEDGNLQIIPEGAGSYIATATQNQIVQSGLWYVGDGGYLTFDVIAFRDGDYAPDLSVSDAAAGMRYVAAAVSRKLHAAAGNEVRPEDIDPYLTCDAITINGRAYPIGEHRATAICQLVERVAGFITRSMSGQNLTGIILTGGGAEVLRTGLEQALVPLTVIVAPNPRRANVLGGFALIGG